MMYQDILYSDAEFQHHKACDTMIMVSFWDEADKYIHWKNIQPSINEQKKLPVLRLCEAHNTKQVLSKACTMSSTVW